LAAPLLNQTGLIFISLAGAEIKPSHLLPALFVAESSALRLVDHDVRADVKEASERPVEQ
jgi:hypothetical protein